MWDAAHEDGVLRSYRWTAQAGPRRVEGTARTRQAVEPHLMVMQLDAGEFNGLLTTELEPEAGATALSVVLSMEAIGILSSMFFGVIRDTIGKGLPVQVEAFAENENRDESPNDTPIAEGQPHEKNLSRLGFQYR